MSGSFPAVGAGTFRNDQTSCHLTQLSRTIKHSDTAARFYTFHLSEKDSVQC